MPVAVPAPVGCQQTVLWPKSSNSDETNVRNKPGCGHRLMSGLLEQKCSVGLSSGNPRVLSSRFSLHRLSEKNKTTKKQKTKKNHKNSFRRDASRVLVQSLPSNV